MAKVRIISNGSGLSKPSIKVMPYRCFSDDCKMSASMSNGTGDGTNIIQYRDVPSDPVPKSLPTDTCDLCKSKGYMKLAEVTHFVAECPDAPVESFNGSLQFHKENITYGFMCEEAYEGFKHPLTPKYPTSFSQVLVAVTCHTCLEAVGNVIKNNQLTLS